MIHPAIRDYLTCCSTETLSVGELEINSEAISDIKNDIKASYLSDAQALALADFDNMPALLENATQWRDQGFASLITYSKKVFIPLTHLCRDVCHYCTFAKTPKRIEKAYLSADEVVAQAQQAAKVGCKEALFTLGEKPELRYRTARDALAQMGFASTLEYVAHVAQRVLDESGVIPHINAGCMTREELAMLRPVSASMGIMLESASQRLCEKGMPHYGSPDKQPEVRLETLRLAGEAKVPFTTGILIGIGETRRERIESLLAIRAIAEQYGHIQEIIIQNFRAKADTKMAQAPEPDLHDLLWTIAIARLIFGPDMAIQAPPNLSPGVLAQIVSAGINDWGGVSPLTPDYVNPEAPWPQLQQLAAETRLAGKVLTERLTVYPQFLSAPNSAYRIWLAPHLQTKVLPLVDAGGYPKTDNWNAGEVNLPPEHELDLLAAEYQPDSTMVSAELKNIIKRALSQEALTAVDIVKLFESRGDEFAYVCQAARQACEQQHGKRVSFVVNRNINYTNMCYYDCKFCAFSKSAGSEQAREASYDLSDAEIQRRCKEAWQRGATEVCMQGGIHPGYSGDTYEHLCQLVQEAEPGLHLHAFSPLEVWQGASNAGESLSDYLQRLKAVGLKTLPGTAAEILDDDVRQILCADKINSSQWFEVMDVAHRVGLKSTATIMFGHVDHYRHWAKHILHVREQQLKTGGFTEFVPLPFVAHEAPIYRHGKARRGPSFREVVLMHAVARLSLLGVIDNIQTSWVKLGHQGVKACLHAGANDLGGTLMNESITRSAGAQHGQETSALQMHKLISSCDRIAWQRTTLYQPVTTEREQAGLKADALIEPINCKPRKRQRQQRVINTVTV